MFTRKSSLTRIVRRVPKQLDVAQDTIKDLRHRTFRMAKHNPGRSLLGAFAIGFAVSRLLRIV